LSAAGYGPSWQVSEPVRIGLFDIRFCDSIPGGVRYWIEGAGFVNPVGVAYAPEGVPRDGSAGRYWPIAGDWYGFAVDF
jgi:hypothetical protein